MQAFLQNTMGMLIAKEHVWFWTKKLEILCNYQRWCNREMVARAMELITMDQMILTHMNKQHQKTVLNIYLINKKV